MKMKGLIIAISLVTILLGCRKESIEKVGEENIITLTEDLLMNKSTTVTQTWYVVDVQRKYVSATGSTDSLVKPGFDSQKIQFGSTSISGGKAYGLVDGDSEGGLALLIPPIGEWVLSGSGSSQTLGFSPSPFFPGGGPGGIFSIQFYEVNDLFYKYGIDAQITRTLPGGRKLVEAFSLGAVY